MALPKIPTGAVTVPASVAVGVGVGGAVGGAIEPRLREIQNVAWRRFKSMPLDALVAAALVASGERTMEWGKNEALNTGIDHDRFEALVDDIDTAPDLGTLLTLLRRGFIDEGDFVEGAKKGTIEDKWIPALAQLRNVPLSADELANARQQGFIGDGVQLDRAELLGLSRANAEIQFQLAGNPPGPMDGLTMLRRGIIDEATYVQIVREGRTKTKYTDAFLALRQQILTATQWVNAWLRGHATEAQAKAGGAEQGYSAEQMDLLYQSAGRPATTRQVHIGYARGATLPGAANEREAFSRSVKQSNLRPEYEDLLWEGRFTYPSAFVIRGLAQQGTFDEATTRTILVESGWKPEWAELAAADWAGTTTAGPGQKWADRARSRVFTEAWNDFLDPDADEGNFREALTAVGATGAEQDTIVNLATRSRSLSRKELTQAQVLKLYRRVIWPREQAQAWLEDSGMTADDASNLLDTVGPG